MEQVGVKETSEKASEMFATETKVILKEDGSLHETFF